MKNILSLAIALMAMLCSHAQPNLIKKVKSLGSAEPEVNVSPVFARSLERIILDFPFNFWNISGNLLISQGEFEQYQSMECLPGAQSCRIGRYHSVRDTTASWQAIMYRSENFQSAANEYKNIYRQLKSTPITMVDGSKFYLVGHYNTPTDDMDFIVSSFTFDYPDRRYKDFKVELELQYELHEWVIYINVVSRKDDAEVRPDWMTQYN